MKIPPVIQFAYSLGRYKHPGQFVYAVITYPCRRLKLWYINHCADIERARRIRINRMLADGRYITPQERYNFLKKAYNLKNK